MARHLGWCSCPECPKGANTSLVAMQPGIRSQFVPTYPPVANHVHQVCDWCSLMSAYYGGRDVAHIQAKLGDELDQIDEFFHCGASSHDMYRIARVIAKVATFIDDMNGLMYGSVNVERWAAEMYELAQEVAADALNGVGPGRRMLPMAGGMLPRGGRGQRRLSGQRRFGGGTPFVDWNGQLRIAGSG